MPHFVCLFDWTDQGSKTVTDTVDRVGSASEMAQSKYGVHLEHIYWTVGAHDLVGVLEAPDVESLSAFLLELAKAGNIRSTTMRAFDRDEMSSIIGRVG
ncbi:MAG: GYD domain-containing protein [Rubrobacter sp.]|nr:GYD domain-containing protein [Rubrobacter sp.]